MGKYSHAGGLSYGNECVPVAGMPRCTHELCPQGQQRSMADMVARHGARIDDGPPTLVVLEPEPDAIVANGFDVVVEVVDGFGGVSAELAVRDLDVPAIVDDSWPLRWHDLRLPAGPHTLEITAYDADHHEVTTWLPIVVEPDAANTSDSDGGSDTDADDDGDHHPGGGGFVPLGTQQATVGCGCTIAPPAERRAGLAVGLLSLLTLIGLAQAGTRSRR
jgi:hypothetical protein